MLNTIDLHNHKDYILDLYVGNFPYRAIAKQILRTLSPESTPEENDVDILRKRIQRFIKSQCSEKEISDKLENQEDESFDETNLNKDLESEENYIYHKETDKYFFFTRFFQKPLVLSGTCVRNMKEDYSQWDDSPASINEICRKHQIPRKVFTKVKTILGWTHDSEPFTDEQIDENDVEELADSALQRKKLALHQKYEKKKNEEIKKNAEKWENFEQNVLNSFLENGLPSFGEYKVPKINVDNKNKEKRALVLSPYDLHYGKYGWALETFDGYDRKQAESLLIQKTQELVDEHLKNYNLEKIIVPIGSDFFHVDHENMTFNGTPQDIDGTINQIIWEGSFLMVTFLDILRQITNVEIVMAPGNHDQTVNTFLLLFLYAWYNDSRDVEVHKSLRMRQYLLYGNTLLGFTHGDRIKHQDLKERMPAEVPDYWAQSKFRAFFTGHRHYELVDGGGSITIYQMPSLSGEDRHHHKKGLSSDKKSIIGYLVSKTGGIDANLMSNITEEDNYNYERIFVKRGDEY